MEKNKNGLPKTEKHAGGRPTKYTDELLSKAIDYIENFHKYDDLIPSVAGLACILDVRRETLHVWANEKPEFSNILRKLSEKQEKVLLRGGISGDFNSTITKLVLAKQGYSEKQDIDHTTNGESLNATINFVKSDKSC